MSVFLNRVGLHRRLRLLDGFSPLSCAFNHAACDESSMDVVRVHQELSDVRSSLNRIVMCAQQTLEPLPGLAFGAIFAGSVNSEDQQLLAARYRNHGDRTAELDV